MKQDRDVTVPPLGCPTDAMGRERAMRAMEGVTLPLGIVRGDDLSRVGGKAANLGAMMAAGLPVPAGFVVTATAFDRFVATCPDHDHLSGLLSRFSADPSWQTADLSRRIQSCLATVPIPAALENEVLAEWRALGTERSYAVRSSATVEDAVEKSDSNGLVLRGIPVSPGVATGRARVILRCDDHQQVLAGEILVAPFTDPAWTPYFLTAAGVVMDQGGILSHGSIVAREYGLPAVTNVGLATRTVQTGDLVEVDGNRGQVAVLQRAADASARHPDQSSV